MALQERLIYRFGRFELDAVARVLSAGGAPVTIAPKTAETLHLLLEHAGSVLTKDFLITTLWPHRIVEEVNLTQQISLLRRALSAHDPGTEFIRNYPGRGYQFVVAVERLAPAALGPPELPKIEQRVAPPPEVPAGPASRRNLYLSLAAVGTLGMLLAATAFLRPDRPAPTPPRRVPFSRLPGSKSHPAITTDGRRVAFVWDRGDDSSTCIWVKDEAQEAPFQVPGTCGNPSSPVWSPDGRELAWLRYRAAASELVIYREFTGERVVASFFPVRSLISNRLLAWSPDGRTIAVSGKHSADEPLAIHLVNAATGAQHRFSRPPGLAIGDAEPAFSPDSSRIAFLRLPSRFITALVTASLSGGPERTVSESSHMGGVVWADGGRDLLFSSNRDGSFRLWRVRADGTDQPRPDVSGVVGENPIQFAFAPAARRVVYVLSGEDLNIWRLHLPSHSSGEPEWKRLIASTGLDASPQFSPDGRQICFLSDRSGSEQIWIANSDGSAPRQMTHGNYLPGHPAWTPDGRGVVFTAHSAEHASRIYVAPTSGEPLRPVAASGSLPLFSRDGSQLYLVHEAQGRYELYVTTVGSAADPVRISSNGAHRTRLAPDGASIYFVRGRTSPEIWQLNPADKSEHIVVRDLIPGYFGFWAPTRDGIYYLGEEADSPVLWFQQFSNGKRSVVTRLRTPLPPLGLAELSVSPDGRDLLMVRRESSSSDLVALLGVD